MPNADKVTLLNADNTPVNSANPLPVSISGSGGGDVEVVGNVANDAADSGNPVKIGGRASNGTLAAVSTGDRVDAWFGLNGNIMAGVVGSVSGSGADGSSQANLLASNGVTTAPIPTAKYIYNGTNWDRQRGPSGTVGSAYVENGPYTASRVTADGQVKATAGFIHTVTFSPTGSVTAGVITIYNSASETGTIVFSCSLPATTFTPFSVTLDVACGTGIYVGYDGTVANVQTTVSFR